MQIFIGIGYFIVGIVQFFAIVDGIKFAWGIGAFLSFLIAGFLTYIPLVGSIFGIYGAMNAWDWSVWQAGTLFFWYIPVVVLVGIANAVASR
ncbi:hypothetical protein [Agrobacterium leguminum]|jgi:hypothetical protein|uniref:hypothetical protein n=1 Tax=Agrobacterium leguminum TaxID=2792015 RepID=UPI003CE4813E